MNVLLITSDLNVLRDQSPARIELEQYSTLAKHVVVVVLNTSRNHYPIQKVSDTLLILPTNASHPLLMPLAAMRLVRRELFFQGKLQTDVVSALATDMSGLTAWLIARRSKTPLLLRIGRDVLSDGYASQSFFHAAYRALVRFLIVRAQALVIATEGIRASLAEISTALADRAMIAPHFMDIEAFNKEPIRVDLAAKYPQFKVIILVVAPLEKSSNVQLAVTILAGICRLYPHVGLVIVGEGSLIGSIRYYVKRVGMEEHVAFEASTDNLSSYFKASRIFLVTAPYEEQGETIAQAAAASCAIVTTKVGIAPLVLEDGISGFLCDPDDAERFVASIVLMLRKPSTCDSIRLNGHLAIEKYMDSDQKTNLEFTHHTWEETIKQAVSQTSS